MGLHWVSWSTTDAVFHAETGETHLLSEMPSLALRLLQTEALSTEDLCVRCAAASGNTDDGPWRRKMLAVLNSLEDRELIERCPSTTA